MKVSTDSCILGAWFAEKVPQRAMVLDIGCGTGLLMMMIAQKTKALIHGIEFDITCFRQLQDNISQCIWKDRLSSFQGDARSFSFPVPYDFIICNPPFFENDLSSPDEEINLARHSSMLSLEELIRVVNNNLSSNGSFGVLIPYTRWVHFNKLCEEQHFYPYDKLFIRHSSRHQFTRAILHYTRKKKDTCIAHEISICKESGNEYTREFIDLLKDYYLYL